MVALHLAVLLACILIGVRLKGVGLGIMGGLGLLIFIFIFQLPPTSPPVDVILMIFSVVTAAAALQVTGGMDYLVHVAGNFLRKNPGQITFLGPLVTYAFTLFAGTAHITYSLLPIISEVAMRKGVRPERPLTASVIAAHLAITASPISAASVALVALLQPHGVELPLLLQVCIPATLIGVLATSLSVFKRGLPMNQDPDIQKRLAERSNLHEKLQHQSLTNMGWEPRLAVALFALGVGFVLCMGAFPEWRPLVGADAKPMRMPEIIEIAMLATAGLLLICTRSKATEVAKSSIFKAGAEAVIAIFGVAWMSDTCLQANLPFFEQHLGQLVTTVPALFAFALFALSMVLFSQAATVRALMPLGISLGIPAPVLLAIFPAVNGDFVIPSYPTLVAAMGFDETGSTRIGKFLINHSFMRPGLVGVGVSVAVGLLMVTFVM